MCIKSIESWKFLPLYVFKVYICVSEIYNMNNREQILTLIESEIVSSKLIFTLNGINIDASDYFTGTSRVVFEMMGIKGEEDIEELYGKYFDMLKQVKYIDVHVKKDRKRLALKCYELLIANS